MSFAVLEDDSASLYCLISVLPDSCSSLQQKICCTAWTACVSVTTHTHTHTSAHVRSNNKAAETRARTPLGERETATPSEQTHTHRTKKKEDGGRGKNNVEGGKTRKDDAPENKPTNTQAYTREAKRVHRRSKEGRSRVRRQKKGRGPLPPGTVRGNARYFTSRDPYKLHEIVRTRKKKKRYAHGWMDGWMGVGEVAAWKSGRWDSCCAPADI